ncbi:MAG: FAD-dependent monooxygenase, partial [Betaproteobacteria bacterium]|nr:FAD-dependent monooxygenase [Betaproteobacteria bacterium]
AAAVLLARDGHRVRVFDRFETPQALGAGILIQPTGLAALRVLGIEQDILAKGARIDQLHGVNHKDRTVVDLTYTQWRPDAFGVGLHRGVLFESLWHAATVAGVDIVTGHEVKSLDALRRDASLAIISDGAHSILRGQTGIFGGARDYPWGALWAVVPDPKQRFTATNTLWQWYRQANQMLGIMPTGQRPGSGAPVVSLFWSLPASELDNWRAAGLAAWKSQVRALAPNVEDVLNAIGQPDALTWAHYADVQLARYHDGNTVVIGDAAHATSPQLGQGTNMALLDALMLTRCLAAQVDIPAALATYTQQRKRHLAYYGAMSRLLTPVFQSHHRVLPWLRDVFMAPVSKVPIAKQVNLQTLTGVRGGWLRGEDARWLAGDPHPAIEKP